MSASVTALSNLLAGTHVDDSDGELSFSGRQIKMNKGEDAKEIIDSIKNSPDLRALRLDGNTMGVEAAKLIGDALATHKEFQRARWSDMFTGRMKTEIPPALKHLGAGIIASGAHLVELDLSDNAFGPIGVEGITDLLKSASCFSLQELRLNNNGLGPNGGKMLASVLEDTYAASTAAGKPLALKVFVSGRGRLENEGSIALSKIFKKMGSLEYVSMPQNGINPPGITALAQCFAFNTNLKFLNLADNTFTVTGAQAMAESIPMLKKLETLNMESCLIRTAGAKAIATALDGDFPNLKEVICNFNEISGAGAVALVESVAMIPSVTTLQLDGNALGAQGKESVRATLEAISREGLVPSMSEDEGTDSEAEDEDENGEVQEHSSGPMVSPKEYMSGPREELLSRIDAADWSSYMSQHLAGTSDDFEVCTSLVHLCMKLCSPLTTNSKPEVTKAAFKLCDKAFTDSADRVTVSALTNSILVNLGLLKSENKKFRRATEDLNGPLLMLNHLVQQDYFPAQASRMLSIFLEQSEKKLEPFFQAKHRLQQTLFSVS